MDFERAETTGDKGSVYVVPSKDGIFSLDYGPQYSCVGNHVVIDGLPASVVESLADVSDLAPLADYISEDSPGVYRFVNGARAAIFGDFWMSTIAIDEVLTETHPPKEAQFGRIALEEPLSS